MVKARLWPRSGIKGRARRVTSMCTNSILTYREGNEGIVAGDEDANTGDTDPESDSSGRTTMFEHQYLLHKKFSVPLCPVEEPLENGGSLTISVPSAADDEPKEHGKNRGEVNDEVSTPKSPYKDNSMRQIIRPVQRLHNPFPTVWWKKLFTTSVSQAAATQSDPPLIKDIRSLIEPYVNLSVREKDQGIKDTSDQRMQLVSTGWENLEQHNSVPAKDGCAQLLNFNVKYSGEWGHSDGKLVSDADWCQEGKEAVHYLSVPPAASLAVPLSGGLPPAQPPHSDFYLNAKLETVAIDFSGVI
ncbi:hypothetical protein EDC04DRAFT_2967436 [Pisolithus marmoratus]|nr:hypothetical protein EDC04DRAFT_2967436 [Pisolithus marmoratus]